MILKQNGLEISGSKTELIDRVLSHAHGDLIEEMLLKMRNLPIYANLDKTSSE